MPIVHGLISPDGIDPREQWASRLLFLGSPPLSRALEELLSGADVDTQTGVLEISWLAVTADRTQITVRRPDAPLLVDFHLSPLTPEELLTYGDPARGTGSLTRWRREMRTGVTRWRFFNARFHTLLPRPNSP